MTTSTATEQVEGSATPAGDAVDAELARQLVERAQAGGLSLVGPDGLLQKLTKLVLETGLEAEMSEHFGYGKHDPARP